MSVERSFEAWEEVQRHGQDLADRLAQGFTGLIQTHISAPFSWPPNPPSPKLFDLDLLPTSSFVKPEFKLAPETINSSILDIGSRIGQAGTDFGNCLNGFLQQFFRSLPLPVPGVSFKQQEEEEESGVVRELRRDRGGGGSVGLSLTLGEEADCLGERLRDFGFVNSDGSSSSGDEINSEDAAGFNVRGVGYLSKPQV